MPLLAEKYVELINNIIQYRYSLYKSSCRVDPWGPLGSLDPLRNFIMCKRQVLVLK